MQETSTKVIRHSLGRLCIALSLAASLSMTAAVVQAEPLPNSRKAKGSAKPGKPNPCAVHGPGFVQAAGSTTCIKIGGKVRFEMGIHRRQNSFRTR